VFNLDSIGLFYLTYACTRGNLPIIYKKDNLNVFLSAPFYVQFGHGSKEGEALDTTWRVITTKSDAEPWWFLEGWEKDILRDWTLDSRNEAVATFLTELRRLGESYPKSKTKKFHSVAFWDPEEVDFCEACDDDLQVYYGLVIFENDKPMEINDDSIITEITNHIEYG
jgi:hypothetical protein